LDTAKGTYGAKISQRTTEVLYNHTITYMESHGNMPTDQEQALPKHNSPTESSIWINSLRSAAYKNSFGTQKTCPDSDHFEKNYHLLSVVQH